MLNFKPVFNNIEAVTIGLLKTLHVRVHSSTVKELLNQHPDYPSLLALSSCLNEWKVENNSYRLQKEHFDPEELTFPFVAHISGNEQRFILVRKIENKQLTFSDEFKENQLMSEADFLKAWSGVILHAEANETSGDPKFDSVRTSELLKTFRLPAIIGVFIVLISLGVFNSFSAVKGMLALLFTAGFCLSIFLLMNSLDGNNPFVQNLCNLAGKNNCNAILKSEASKLTPWLSWSEVGFFYFSGSLLSLIFLKSSLPLLAMLSMCSLPYTIYSIGFQYRNKNWCMLCCAIQVILWLGAFLFYFSGFYDRKLLDGLHLLNVEYILLFIFCFLVPIAIWGFVKPFMLGAVQVDPLKAQLRKFKYNSKLFNQILTAQPRVVLPSYLNPISLGNPEAETVITMVSNPYCGPCARTHQILENWISASEVLQLKIIFANGSPDDHPKTKVARHLTALGQLKDKHKITEALSSWYNHTNSMDFDVWSKKFPVLVNHEIEETIRRQKDWCDLSEIKFTPTIFINGYQLPEPYLLEDLKYLLGL